MHYYSFEFFISKRMSQNSYPFYILIILHNCLTTKIDMAHVNSVLRTHYAPTEKPVEISTEVTERGPPKYHVPNCFHGKS